MKTRVNPILFPALLMGISLSSCSTAMPPQSASTTFVQATPIVTYPEYVGVPATNNVKLVTGQDPALEKAFKQYASTGKAPDIISDGFITLAYNKSQQPIIKTMQLQQTVVSLEPGEKFTDISSGDPSRWDYSVAESGVGSNKQQHVLIKPSLPNLATTMVIATDRRMYTLRLISSNKGAPMRDVRFWYPDQLMSEVNSATKKQVENETMNTSAAVDISNMNFNYQISTQGGGFWSSAPSWKPVQVFDDGRETFIQFPANVSSGNLPALQVDQNGQFAIVNYRKKDSYFVVDMVFKKAVLVMGVGGDATQVSIVNLNYR